MSRRLASNDGYAIFVVAITVILAVLKLIGLIDWSWWIITAALWLPPFLFAFLMLCIIVLKIISGFYFYVSDRRD